MIGAGPVGCATGGFPCTLEPHGQARGIHHDEHVFEPAIRLADEMSQRAVPIAEGQHAGRARMNPELVLDGDAAHLVASTERAVVVDEYFRHDKQGDALHARGRAIDAAEHHVDGVAGEIVITPGDEDLLPKHPEIPAVRHRTRSHLREVGASLRLGQIHRSGPLAAHHLRQEQFLLCWRTAQVQSMHGTVRQHGTEFEREVRGGPQFLHRRGQHLRDALAPVFGIRAELRPTAGHELLISRAKAGRRDDTLRRPPGAFDVAGLVERVENGLRKARRFVEYRPRELI
jgi:hypothetical protein